MLVTLLRTVILYICVILALRIMGKRQIGDMQPGELVITFLISELASMPIQDTTQPVITGLIAIFTLVAMELLISFLAMKFAGIHKLINGRSGVLIRDGVIDQKEMTAMRVTVDDLLEELRGQSVFDVSQVAYAILETNGSLSILLKGDSQPLTPAHMDISPGSDGIKALVVDDGAIVEEGLRLVGIDRKQVQKAARKQGLAIEEIFLMTADGRGGFYTVKKEAKK